MKDHSAPIQDEDASENDENDEFDLLNDQEIPFVVEQWL